MLIITTLNQRCQTAFTTIYPLFRPFLHKSLQKRAKGHFESILAPTVHPTGLEKDAHDLQDNI